MILMAMVLSVFRLSDFYLPFGIFEFFLIISQKDDISFHLFRLYIMESLSKLSRIPSDPETKQKLKDHLLTGADGKCKGLCVEVNQKVSCFSGSNNIYPTLVYTNSMSFAEFNKS